MISATGCGDDGRGASGATDSTTGGTTQAGTTGITGTTGTTAEQPTTGVTGGTSAETTSTTAVDPTATVGTGTTGTTGDLPCGGCPGGFICKYEQCLPNLGDCVTYDDCPGDSYCDPDGVCIPYGVPEGVINDPNCTKPSIPEGVTPALQCEWKTTADPDDLTYASTQIYTTPTIADLNLDKDPGKLQPSIVVTTFHVNAGNRIGTLRVFDGRTCKEQMRAGGLDEPNLDNRPTYASTWAIGDLDGDVPGGGHPELISYHLPTDDDGDLAQLYAFRINSDGITSTLERMWYGRDCANNDTVLNFSNGTTTLSPLLIDLDDDERPEILVGQQVFDADGCLLTTWNAASANGMHDVADVDLDGAMDLVLHNRVFGWDNVTTEWVVKPWFVPDPAQLAGYTGIADVGLYSAIAGVDPAQQPEVVVLSSPGSQGQIRVQSLDGAIVWGPIPTYKTGGLPQDRGGPLTISDFDGDGQVEFASAGASQYVVYDPDCVAGLMGESPPERPGGKCERAPDQQSKNLPDGVLWAQPSKDESSNITGSSIFDFDGDGAGEVVYRDECYLRVYDGKSGAVLFSAPASSGTGLEYPTIADVDGDFATEIVVPRTPYNACPATDPLFPDSGTFYTSRGFAVYRDPLDRWANSRPVWNQHVYSVSHVTDDARVPRLSEYVNNWQTPGLNNLRQNSQGDLGLLQIADLTVELTDLGALCEFGGGSKDLQAEVCNRGTNPVQDGVLVHFLETVTPDQDISEATVVCSANTTKLLYPGECELVSCIGMLGGTGNIYVDVDPEDTIADCHPGNNLGADAFELCPG